ncbi:GlcG/HbpS family heme-binding protein [Crenothrix polyspora]|uniref:Heme-binding protein n=1 Tax=Crenothrix polyspora TaxID=360316 RepID=A0A1R4GZ50_9GAMM|nr:heme-binding protein [Crenothrix polyspora]SJM89232.1 conserved exported hypothetical protein [Crenothrix polyspora]
MKKSLNKIFGLFIILASTTASAVVPYKIPKICQDLPTYAQLKAALSNAQSQTNGGFGLHMWASVVNRDGFVCAVAYSGADRNKQWPGSRIISAQKAYTANAFSLDGLALSTANIYSAIQPGGSLFGLQASNPIDPATAYLGSPLRYGTEKDPLVGKKIGGINGFGGGLGLYKNGANNKPIIVGAIGVSGDSSCADHNIAWRTRSNLVGFNILPAGVSNAKDDGIVYDTNNIYTGWEHPKCSSAAKAASIAIGAGS